MEADGIAEPTPIRGDQNHSSPKSGAIMDPSKYIVQYSWETSGVGSWTSVHSATKSVRA